MANEIEYIYPATSLQQGFIYHALSQPGDDAYRMQVLYDYHQAVDIEKYIQAWEYCIARYPILRTAFNWEEDLIQVIYKKGKLDCQLHDVSHLATQQGKDDAIDAIQTADRKIGYDLTSPTLLRLHIIKQSTDYYTVLKSQHHAITDGWSEPVLLSCLHKYYKALVEQRQVIAKEDTAYIEAQEYIAANKAAIQQYWNKAFEEAESANDISALLSEPFDAARYRRVESPAEQSYEIRDDFYTRLKSFSQEEGITVNVMLQFAWHKLLQVYSSRQVSIVGTTVSGRNLPVDGIEESVGLYVNTLPLAVDWENDLSVREQLHQVQQKIIELNTHSFADLAKIQKNGERLFHSLFVYENYPGGKEEPDSLKITTRNDIDKADYPLGILAFEHGDKVVFTLQYDGNYLTRDKAGKHIETLVYFLQQIITNPEKKHKQLNLLTPEAYHEIVYKWNMTDKDYPQEKTIHALFEAQAGRTPDNTAIVYRGAAMSYQELNEKSNQLAREIRERFHQKNDRPLSPDSLLSICVERGFEMIIGILAILKAGAAYVPVDPRYPTERIDYLLADTQAAFILSQRKPVDEGNLLLPGDKVIYIDLTEPLYSENSTGNLALNCSSRNLAYVIYTSGTTGKPKGVMVEHAGVTNEILSQLAAIPITSSDRSLLTADLVFDAAAECIYMALLSGGALHILDFGSILDGDFVRKYIDSSSITVVNTTPSYLKAISVDSSSVHLKYIILGGESYQKIESSARIYNSYGPTETTIVSTLTEINNNEEVHIGKPIDNTRAYVLDANDNPVPVGVTGELYLGGAGVARGYLNRPELTSERFVFNPFATEADRTKGHTRLYKTGDMVRWLPDGNLEYIGRNDEQVKINGYRIELAEVTHAVTAIKGIKQACVLAKERKTGIAFTKYLVCYYVAAEGEEALTPSLIQNKLLEILPAYMVPGTFVAMESFPLTVNGKLDKRALSDPGINLSETEHVAPVNEIEKELCKIWEQVFGVENISTTDNFFRIGGDSILSIQVSGRIRQAGYPCQVKDIFEYKTISKLAAHLSKKNQETAIEAEQGKLTGELGFLPIQEWFILQAGKEFAKPGHWNQSFLIKVPELEIKRLETMIGELVAHNDVFRIRYIKEQQDWKQVYQEETSLPALKILDVSKHTAIGTREILTAWQSDFDLEQGSLFQAGYLYGYADGSARIFMAMHHMIVDSVSWRILAEDLNNLYAGTPLPSKTSSYRQWVASVKKYAAQHPAESAYWEDQLKGMPVYRPRQLEEPSEEIFELTEGLTTSLLQEASKAYHTEVNDLLSTALAFALKDINQAETQAITLEGHGREEIDPSIDHSRTIGWFTTMFPVKLELKSNIKESVQFIKESLRKIPNKGIGFGAFATEKGTPYTQNNLPQISFNYLGQFDGSAGDWQITPEDSGKNVDAVNADHNVIFIDGMVSGGKLKFSVGTRLGAAVTRRLSSSFKTQLTSIIAHCLETLENKGSSYTPVDFKAVRISQSLLNGLGDNAKLNRNQIDHIYPATSLQQGFIYHALSQPGDDAYRMQVLLDYHQPIDVAKYLQAWEYCIARYPILRAAFNWEEDLIQVIYKKGRLDYRLHDISQLATQKEKDNAIDAILAADKEIVYDLASPTLLRLNIIKQAVNHYTVIKSEHHAITDGWSGPVLLASLHQFYQALVEDRQVIIKEDTAYIEAQEYITANKAAIQQYWNKAFEEAEAANDISALLTGPFDAARYRRVERPAEQNYEIKDDFYARLKSFSQEEGITVNVVLQFAWHKLLQVYSAKSPTIVGTTISGRDLPVDGIEESVGLYVNTLPLAVDWENDFSVREQLHQVQQKIIELNTHSFADLAKIQKNGERLFHSLFVYENYPEPKESGSILKAAERNVADRLDYPIGLIVFEQGGALVVRLVYDADLLKETDARHHLLALNRIIGQVIDQPAKPHHQISLLSADEHQKIIHDWNITDTDYPGKKAIVQLFEEQVFKTPGNIALVYDGKQLSYSELNEKSNQLARHIRTQYRQKTGRELVPDTLIALYIDRGLEMVVAILAVLKAGGAYVPIEVNYPQERVDFILGDGEIKLILTQRHLSGDHHVKLPGEMVINVDLLEGIYALLATNNLPAGNMANDLACLLYTSGTTGKPKGVMLTHISLANRVLYMIERSNITLHDHYLFKTNYVFDVSASDIFAHLCAGAKLHITKHVFDLTELKHLLQSVEFTSLHLVPSQYDLLAGIINGSSISKLYFSGEAITPQIISVVNENIDIFNYYGPTETGEITVSNPKTAQEYAVIGSVFPNSRQYVLGPGGTPVPIGVTGELFIGGVSLARGYLNRPDLSDERFINNPFATALDKELGYTKLYKTGDLVQWMPNGDLVYIGRNDGQVKIRGYRIELGEIEHAMAQVNGIKQSCVLAKERKTSASTVKYLAAYYVADKDSDDLTHAVIAGRLSQLLPGHMVPDAFVEMQCFPLTANGKLDKHSLPEPDFGALNDQFVGPATELEAGLCRIWEEVLEVERVGMTDDFFGMGGNSILAIQASHRMGGLLGYEVRVGEIFKYKNIHQILTASFIEIGDDRLSEREFEI